jgi:SM-20-related protein
MEVKVKIFLVGGYHYTVNLHSDSPLLKSLFEVVVSRTRPLKSGCHQSFQIPLDEGKSLLSFVSDELVAIATQPALAVKQVDEFLLSDSWFFDIPDQVLPAKYVTLDNFLTPAENQALLNLVLRKEGTFVDSGHAGNFNYEHRRSKVSAFAKSDEREIHKRLRDRVPEVLKQLAIEPFEIGEIETQITASNDGDYYKIHQDQGKLKNASRILTYVYYFYREPKSFSGGELIMYDGKMSNNDYVKADSYQVIAPRNNSIIFFPSHYWHEVLPVNCPSQKFADSRFTINGWIRHA